MLDKEDSESLSDLKQDHKITDKNVNDIIKGYKTQTDGYLNPIFINFLLLSTFDYNSEIDVNILGHIFEQSLTDLEELQANLSLERKKQKSKKKRKEEGIYYTPDYITKYICQNTIIPYLSKINKNTTDELLEEYTNGELDELLERVKNIKILDLACGSGAFLKQAYKVLIEIHKLIKLRKKSIEEEDGIKKQNEKLEKVDKFLKEKTFAPVDSEIRLNIVSNNIFGVDKNEESIGITKLSLFLEVATKGEKLPNLSDNIKYGNSLIKDPEGELEEKIKAINWTDDFKEVMDGDGFDIIIGNPPYIKHEKIKEEKPFLKGNFEVYDGLADLYCYFYERGLNLLRDGGILGFITSNKWMETKYGLNLRKYLKVYYIEEFVNFFELKVFQDASTEPAILIIKKMKETNKSVKVTLVDNLEFQNFNQYITDNAFTFNQENLDDNKWNFSESSTDINNILEKMKRNSVELREYIGETTFRRGLMTGKTDAFVINKQKYEELIRKDSKSKEIIRPLINGVNIHNYAYEFTDKFIIVTKIGTDINKYKAVKEYLLKFKKDLENRHSGSKGDKWFELRKCAYYDEFEEPKIVYIRTAKNHKFALDLHNGYLISNCFFINSEDKYLLAYLNSDLFEFYKINSFVAFGNAKSKGRCKLDGNKMDRVPIIPISKSQQKKIEGFVDQIINKKTLFLLEKQKFLSFIVDLHRIPKLSQKLVKFWNLNSADFLDEIQKKIKLSVKELKELSDLFLETLDEKIRPLIKDSEELEGKINDFIFDIYKIDQEEKEFIVKFLKK